MTKEPIPFRAFDENGEVRIYYHGILPHWRQRGRTYFVTFRLADSIPQHVLDEIEENRTLWLKAHGIDAAAPNWKQLFAKLPPAERRACERLVGRFLNDFLDEGHGDCVLRDPAIHTKVASALDHFHGSRVWTGDFVVMPNHVHALLTPIDDFELEDILHSIKSFTAHQINRALHLTGSLWQKESHDHIVRDTAQLEAYQQYIAYNPSKAKLQDGEYILAKAEYKVVLE